MLKADTVLMNQWLIYHSRKAQESPKTEKVRNVLIWTMLSMQNVQTILKLLKNNCKQHPQGKL